MNVRDILLITLLFFLGTSSVRAFNVIVAPTEEGLSKSSVLYGIYTIEGRDLVVDIEFYLTYTEEYVKNNSAIVIFIDTQYQHWNGLPDWETKLCSGNSAMWYNYSCPERFSLRNDTERAPLDSVGSKKITIEGLQKNGDTIGVLVKFRLPNAVMEMGDYYYFPIHFNSVDFKSSKHTVYFPSNILIPFTPKDVDFETTQKFQNDTFVMTFNGTKDKLFFYYDPNKVEQKNDQVQKKYMWRGFWWSLLPATLFLFIGLAIDLLFGPLIRKWLILKWERIYKNQKVVVNTTSNRYHHINCEHVDKIKNNPAFLSKQEAQRCNYQPCKYCFDNTDL